jgi:hypothetical protein
LGNSQQAILQLWRGGGKWQNTEVWLHFLCLLRYCFPTTYNTAEGENANFSGEKICAANNKVCDALKNS